MEDSSFITAWEAPNSLRRHESVWRILQQKAGGEAVNVKLGCMDFTTKSKGASFTARVKSEDGEPLPAWFDELLDKRFARARISCDTLKELHRKNRALRLK